MDSSPISAHAEQSAPLPSRAAALTACREALTLGPVLLTGAAGVGKTRLARDLASADRSRRWIVIDAAPGMSPGEFLSTAVAALGGAGGAGSVRLALNGALGSLRQDGFSVGLVLDEAHLAADDLLEEVRLLANRLGRGDGFDALMICGQTPLARRMDRKPLDSLESRLSARVHLLPLDLDEATLLAEGRAPSVAADRDRMERLHRDSGGNPARLLRLIPREPKSARKIEHEPATALLSPEPLVPAKPPLRVEDGLIEVGWDADEPEPSTETAATWSLPAEPADDDEPVADHYAALQAWDEWARNQGRAVTDMPADPIDEDAQAMADEEGARAPLDAAGGLWADGRQGFAPYSQLFSRTKPLQGAE